MKTKKLLALLMAGTMSVSMLSGCGGSAAKTDDSSADAADTSASAESDMDYVKSNGKLVIGITDFAPMDYKEDGSDEWVGFDADMAKAFAESLGVKAEFIEINWDNKIMELDSKGVDAVWNGMTLTDEVKTSMNCSDPYATNAQVVHLQHIVQIVPFTNEVVRKRSNLFVFNCNLYIKMPRECCKHLFQ